jgi:hypothetical protein
MKLNKITKKVYYIDLKLNLLFMALSDSQDRAGIEIGTKLYHFCPSFEYASVVK